MVRITKGKWAQGIKPRAFAWIIKDKLAICERPGGYGANHRRVRRQEEIIWIREQGFAHVISLIPSTHNLHNYDELGVSWLHRPLLAHEDPREFVLSFYPELKALLSAGKKIIIEIRGLRIIAVHGVNAEERVRAQPFELDLDIALDLSIAGQSDDLADTVDYGALVQAAERVVTTESYQLLERVARRVADELLVPPAVHWVRVTIRKLRPPLPIDVASTAVTIRRDRAAST